MALSYALSLTCLAEAPRRPSQVRLTDSVALDVSKASPEIVSWMTEIGVDYPLLLQKARSADSRSLRLYLWLGGNTALDGAASEGYGNDLYQIATKVGDEVFSQALHNQPREVVEACYRYLCFETSEADATTLKAATAVSLILPKTLEVIKASTTQNPLWK